jgi:glycosyltransferase involved in cell wall biosynthesis
MKIALVIHELLVEGGGERLCVALARALSQQGHQVVLYTSAYDRANCFPDICKELVVTDVGRGPLPWIRKPLFIRGYFDMKQLVAAIGESHEIWNPHHWPAQWGALWLKQKLGGKVIWMCNDVPNFHPHAQHHAKSVGFLRNMLHRFYYLYDRSQNQAVDLTILLSKWAEADFRAIYSAPTQILRAGFDPTCFMPGGRREAIRQRFGYTEGDFVLLWLGIFMPHRRLEDAIHALSRVLSRGHKVKLFLAGSTGSFPEYFRSLKELANRLGVQQAVTFADKVADNEICDFYSSCDAFLFPNDLQTWGLVVLEAMACGCPVLVSRGAGVHEVLTDGKNALLFPPRSPEILADKIELLITHPQMRTMIARNGMELARARYTWEQYASEFSLICHTFADSPRAEAIRVTANSQGLPRH